MMSYVIAGAAGGAVILLAFCGVVGYGLWRWLR
jgi:hypothetical protein